MNANVIASKIDQWLDIVGIFATMGLLVGERDKGTVQQLQRVLHHLRLFARRYPADVAILAEGDRPARVARAPFPTAAADAYRVSAASGARPRQW